MCIIYTKDRPKLYNKIVTFIATKIPKSRKDKKIRLFVYNNVTNLYNQIILFL